MQYAIFDINNITMKFLKNSFRLYEYAVNSERKKRSALVFFSVLTAFCLFYIYPFISTAFLESSVGSYLIEENDTQPLGVTSILEKDIFGSASAPAQTASRPVFSPTIALTLKGVMRNKDPEKSRAIVAAAGGKSKIYSIDDTLPGNVVLEAINDTSITILKNGSSVTIPIKK